MPKRPLLGSTSGRQERGTPNSVEQLVGPVAGVDVVEQRAARVRRVGRVHAAVGAAGEAPQDPRVDGAEREVGVRLEPSGREQPRELRRRRSTGRARARCARGRAARAPRSRQLVAPCRGAAVLPHDRAVRVGPVARSHTTTVSRWFVMPIAATVSPALDLVAATSASVVCTRLPDVVGVVLDPARPREVLRELAVRRGQRAAVVTDGEACARRSCPRRSRGRPPSETAGISCRPRTRQPCRDRGPESRSVAVAAEAACCAPACARPSPACAPLASACASSWRAASRSTSGWSGLGRTRVRAATPGEGVRRAASSAATERWPRTELEDQPRVVRAADPELEEQVGSRCDPLEREERVSLAEHEIVGRRPAAAATEHEETPVGQREPVLPTAEEDERARAGAAVRPSRSPVDARRSPGARTASTAAARRRACSSHERRGYRGLSSWGAMRIGLLNGGGDCPGLNAVIRAVVRKGEGVLGHKIVGLPPRLARCHRGRGGRADRRARREGCCTAAARSSARRGRTRTSARVTSPRCSTRCARERVDVLIAIGGEDTLGVAHRLLREGVACVGVPEDDRQRPLRDRLHVRLRHRGADRDRRDRPAAHDGREPRPRDGRRGDGSARGVDRAPLGARRRRRHDPHPRGAVRHRRGVRAAPASPRAGRELLDRRRGRGRDAARGHDGDAGRRARRVRARAPRRHRGAARAPR